MIIDFGYIDGIHHYQIHSYNKKCYYNHLEYLICKYLHCLTTKNIDKFSNVSYNYNHVEILKNHPLFAIH